MARSSVAVCRRYTDAESSDNGARWFATQIVAIRSTTGTNVNDWASVVWPTASTRIVTWNGWTSGTSTYRQFLRIGTETPTNPVAAAVWTADPALAPTMRVSPPDPRVAGAVPAD